MTTELSLFWEECAPTRRGAQLRAEDCQAKMPSEEDRQLVQDADLEDPPCFSLLQNPNDLRLSKQTFSHVVLLALFAFGRTLFLTGVDLGGAQVS